MQVILKRQNKAVHFKGFNERELSIDLDGSKKIGGEDKGPTPMELVLMAAAGCSSIDVHSILSKMRQDVDDFQVEVDGERVDGVPAVFKKITLHYRLWGDIKPEKAKKAVSMSLEKYCSVTKMLAYSVDIAHRISLNGEAI